MIVIKSALLLVERNGTPSRLARNECSNSRHISNATFLWLFGQGDQVSKGSNRV